MPKHRLFISYKRNVEPDGDVVQVVLEKLRPEFDIFIDQDITVGQKWGIRIEEELRRADFLIVFLYINTAYYICKAY